MGGYIVTDISYPKSLTCPARSYVSVGNLKQTLLCTIQSFMLYVLIAAAILQYMCEIFFCWLGPIFNRLLISCIERRIRSTRIIALKRLKIYKAFYKYILRCSKKFKKRSSFYYKRTLNNYNDKKHLNVVVFL